MWAALALMCLTILRRAPRGGTEGYHHTRPSLCSSEVIKVANQTSYQPLTDLTWLQPMKRWWLSRVPPHCPTHPPPHLPCLLGGVRVGVGRAPSHLTTITLLRGDQGSKPNLIPTPDRSDMITAHQNIFWKHLSTYTSTHSYDYYVGVMWWPGGLRRG